MNSKDYYPLEKKQETQMFDKRWIGWENNQRSCRLKTQEVQLPQCYAHVDIKQREQKMCNQTGNKISRLQRMPRE